MDSQHEFNFTDIPPFGLIDYQPALRGSAQQLEKVRISGFKASNKQGIASCVPFKVPIFLLRFLEFILTDGGPGIGTESFRPTEMHR